MAHLTEQEKAQMVAAGLYINERCDSEKCRRPITSTLRHYTKDGRVACSILCRNEMESGENVASETKSKKEKTNMAKDEKELKKAKKQAAEEKEEKKAKKASKKAAIVEDEDEDEDEDEEETPKKKKGAKKAADEDEKPSKKSKKSKKSDDDDDDEDEDEAPKKKSKKSKSDDDDDDEDEKPSKKKAKKGDDKPASRTGKYPFAEDSVIFKAFKMALEGTTVKDITKLCNKEGIGAQRVMFFLKDGTKENGFKGRGVYFWDVKHNPDSGSFKIVKFRKEEE